MNPTDRRYHKGHAWAKLEGDTATIGISDYAQSKLKNIVFIELPHENDAAVQGKKIGAIESIKSVSEVISPVSGTVIAVNEELLNTPEIINRDPYNKGWIAKIKIKDKQEYNTLLSAADYEKSLSR